MAIEFRCTECNRLLSTPEGTEGRQARCPQCGALSPIPQADTAEKSPIAAAPVTAPAPFAADNPYHAPSVELTQEIAPSEPTPIEFSDCLGRAWRIYKANFGKCAAISILIVIFSMIVPGAVGFAMQGESLLVRMPINLVLNVFRMWLSLGLSIYVLKICRGQSPKFADVFSGGPYLLRAIGLWIIITIAIVMGFLLLIIPGIIVSLMFWPATLFVVDQNASIGESLRLSMRATKGNKLTLFALGVVTSFLTLLVMLLTCGIGTLFFISFPLLIYVLCYLAMTGQSTVD